jgi:hypothetical protein
LLRANALLAGGDGTLTLSFAPDGTRIGDMPSALFSTFGAMASADQWQATILRAFQTWTTETNAIIGLVADNGAPFGVTGESRGDTRFGDIRIGAAPLAEGIFAIAIPAGDLLSGTWVGDVIFNANAPFTNLDEIFVVALHEAGHVFGLDHTDSRSSPMHVHGITPASVLTVDDISAIQALYGAPQPDINELVMPNDSFSNPTTLKVNAGMIPEAPSVTFGAITRIGDIDYFRLSLPSGFGGPITISVRTAELSLLALRLTVYDGQGVKLGEVASTNVGGDLATITLDDTIAAGQLLVRVDGARSDVFGTGAYLLSASFNELSADHAAMLAAADGFMRFLPQHELAKLFRRDGESNDFPYFNDDGHADDVHNGSVRLTSLAGFPVDARYEAFGSIANSADVDHYRVMSPANGGNVMTARVRSLDPRGLIPQVAAYGKDGEVLPLQVLVNGAGEHVVQVTGVESRSNVTLRVSAARGAGMFADGNYLLSVGFGNEAIQPPPVLDGQINAESPIQHGSLYVAQPQLFDFALAVRDSSATNAAAMATIYDATNKIVFRVAAKPGETRTAGSVLLAPGSYVIQIAGVSLEPLPGPLEYTLYAIATSAPFTANPDDPTLEPEFLCDHPEHEGLYCYPGGIVSADPYLWSNFIDSLDETPTGPSYSEIISALLGDWWAWVWQELGANGPPLAQDDAVRIGAGGDSSASSFALSAPLNVLDNDIEPENEAVVALLQSGTQHGVVTLNPDGTFEYSPDEEFVGVDSFTYVAYDLSNESEAATVRISVGFRGDYDGDLTVNGADFLAWQRDFGQSIIPAGAGADGDGDGQIDAGDLWAWSYNLGNSRTESYSSAGASSVEATTESLQFNDDAYSLGALTVAGASSAGDVTQVTTDLNLRLAALSQPALSATHAATFGSTGDSFYFHPGDLNCLSAENPAIDRRPLVNPPTNMFHGHVGKLDWLGAESSDAQGEIDLIDLAFSDLSDECLAEART